VLLTSDRRKSVEFVDNAVRDFDDLAAHAPAEIKSDIDAEAKAFHHFRDELEKADYDIRKLPRQAIQALEGPPAQRLANYLRTRCGIVASTAPTTR
jgi:hypothetical protein